MIGYIYEYKCSYTCTADTDVHRTVVMKPVVERPRAKLVSCTIGHYYNGLLKNGNLFTPGTCKISICATVFSWIPHCTDVRFYQWSQMSGWPSVRFSHILLFKYVFQMAIEHKCLVQMSVLHFQVIQLPNLQIIFFFFSKEPYHLSRYAEPNWAIGLSGQKQICITWLSNSRPRNIVRCNYLFVP